MIVPHFTRRRCLQTATTGLIVITGGCIDQAQDLVIGGREREILSRYETTYEIATQSVRMAATGIDRIEADDWQAAEPKLRTSRELAQRSIGRFRETYQQARFIANTKVQRSVTESWTKVLKVRDFTTEALTAVNYMKNGSEDSATRWLEDEAMPHWEAAQKHELIPPNEIKRELGL